VREVRHYRTQFHIDDYERLKKTSPSSVSETRDQSQIASI
jgi:hypothetical protein